MVSQNSNKQQGAVVISLSVIFLLLTTFVTLYVTKTILLEQKIINNQVRSKLAFEAAEYGISSSLQYLFEGGDRDGDGLVDPIFDITANADGKMVGTTNESAVDKQSVVVTIEDIDGDPDELLAFRITAQGFSDDKSATRIITQVVKVKDALPNAPDNPFTAKGTVNINGSATVHNPEGTSTVWSGQNVDLSSNNAMGTYVADPGDPNYPHCMDTPMSCDEVSTSNKVTMGVDVIEHDSNLTNLSEEEMFINYFGMGYDAYRQSTVSIDIANPVDFPSNVGLAENEVVWYDGDASFNGGTYGCSVDDNAICSETNEAPAIIIIDGNLALQGNPTFYGVVYITGDLTFSGNPTFYGAVIVNGSADTTGSIDIWYNSRLLSKARRNGGFASASGAWKDF